MPFADVEGRSIAYRIHGPVNGLPLLLVHGFPLTGELWLEQARVLGDVLGYRIIIPDLRGYGASSAAPSGAITMDDFASDVLGVADALGIDRFVLGGLSMGGYISFAIMRRAQARIVGLILADTRAGADSPAAQQGREALAQATAAAGPQAAIDAMVPRFFAPATYQGRPDLVQRVETMIRTIAPATIAATARGLAQRPDSSELLGKITCPTLILCGAEDALMPPTESRFIHEHLFQARLVLIPGAGHLANWEDPAVFTAAMAGFLEALR